VGRGQLDYALRGDPRVHVIEGKNARHLTPDDLPCVPSLAVVDVSFISLRQVLPAVVPCLAAEGEIVALVKPQFEVGRRQVGRGGIVRDPSLHRKVLESLAELARFRGWGPVDAARAALRGAEGNQEFFLHLRPASPGTPPGVLARRIREVVVEREGE
jgi:23S rRNA (cytidine1920-2'-O)/16S rRNA (cytidine1409-2'-O)-methyltransferase